MEKAGIIEIINELRDIRDCVEDYPSSTIISMINNLISELNSD